MVMVTKFINATSSAITLKEADSGIQRVKFKMDSSSHVSLELETNATYREYHLFMIPSCNASSVVVSSDDLADNKVITITEVSPGVFSWEGTPRSSATKPKRKLEDSPRNVEGQRVSSFKLGRWLSNLSSWIS